MATFLGTHQNRLDAKGRVSVPAPFRNALRSDDESNATHLVLRPSHQHRCIEAWPGAVFEALSEPLNRLDLFSQAHDDLAASLYSDAFPVEADKEGRIVLPDSLISYAGLSEAVVFMGLGRIFQIWEPGGPRSATESTWKCSSGSGHETRSRQARRRSTAAGGGAW